MARLLIVDDEQDVREFAANFFRKRNVEVVPVASGEEALERIARVVPDLILLDIKMAGIDGVETLRRLRASGNLTRVIMVTGRKPEENDTYAECEKLGIRAYVHKPLELEELERIVLKELFLDAKKK